MLPLIGVHFSFTTSGGFPLGFFLIFLAIVLLSLCASVWTAGYASRKGFPFWPILVACIFINFPIVLLVVALMPARQPPPGPQNGPWR